MTTTELKSEIQRILDQVPEDILTDILYFLKELEKHSAEDIHLVKFMKQILVEDKELLEKLAK